MYSFNDMGSKMHCFRVKTFEKFQMEHPVRDYWTVKITASSRTLYVVKVSSTTLQRNCVLGGGADLCSFYK